MVVLCLVLGKSRGSSLRHVITLMFFLCVCVQVVVFFGFMGSIYAMRNHRKTMKELAHKNLNGIVSNRRTAGGGGATVHPLVRACFFDFSVVCCCVFTQFLFLSSDLFTSPIFFTYVQGTTKSAGTFRDINKESQGALDSSAPEVLADDCKRTLRDCRSGQNECTSNTSSVA